jgi:hypothetical protein
MFLRLLIGSAVYAGLPLVFFANSAVAAVTTPNYVQGNYAAPRPQDIAVNVPYTAAQTAGDLNVVIVGWNDSTAQVSSLTDSNGNVYQLAVGPIVTGTLSQAIYYAKNISAAAAATNAVTVTFNRVAYYPDIRILEYSGIDPGNPVDTVVGASGNSATSSSGVVTTTNPTDLLVGANVVWTVTTGPGSGFTQRLLTSDGDIAEDQRVTATGSYGASAPLDSAGPWIMQMVAFRAAGSPTPTPTPTPTPPPVMPGYVQGNYAVPRTPQTSVTVPFTAAQTAGDLNVVIVGWINTTGNPSSLTDSNGNNYQFAIGSVNGVLSQVICYATNISAAKAGSNALTVTFNGPVSFPDIRILEYSGIDPVNPLDTAVSAQGNSATSSSGAVTTSNDEDLLVGANVVWTATTGPGSGFTQRLLTPDGDIAEDQVVTAPGSYSASTPLTSAGPWIMQMAAFRAASSASSSSSSSGSGSGSASGSSSNPTPTPTPTPNPSPTPAPTPPPGSSSTVTLAWDADLSTGNPATQATGYRLYIGLASGNYTQSIDVGNTTTDTVSNLVSGTRYYSVITAYDSAGLESLPSNEISYVAP